MHSEQFEPIYLVPEGPARPTEAGKRWIEGKLALVSGFADIFRDLARLTPTGLAGLARHEMDDWDPRLAQLRDAAIPMCASGINQAIMQKVLDYCDGKTTTAFSPAAFAMALGQSAPSSTTVINPWPTSQEGGYTGYTRITITTGNLNAATGATPSVVTNSATLTGGACTASSATFLGFIIGDNATIGSGTSYFFGSLTSTTIDTTHTPPTIASGALSLSLNTT